MFFTYHLFQHTPYSLTRFHRCHFLTRQISLGASSGSRHPTPGSPCHHGNGCVRTDVPRSFPYFPASVEFWMQILRWGEKNLISKSIFCNSFLFFWSLGQNAPFCSELRAPPVVRDEVESQRELDANQSPIIKGQFVSRSTRRAVLQ